jgi:hypothetical protein
VVPLDLYRLNASQQGSFSLKVNGKLVKATIENGFATINRKWKKGDIVEVDFPMPVQKVFANEKVAANKGRLALKRGPVIYCIEGKDQADDRVLNVFVPENSAITNSFNKDLFGGIHTLNFSASLSRQSSEGEPEMQPINLKAIPYFMWANRGADNMLVWMPYEIGSVVTATKPTLATKAKISASEGCRGNLKSVNDQMPVKNAADHESTFVHWWPKFATTEWLQYEFEKEEEVGTIRVYFFDDESINGGCRIPKSWTLKYLENGTLRTVYPPEGFKIVKDGWTEIHFEPVKTKTVRLELTFQDGVSGGLHEWEIW